MCFGVNAGECFVIRITIKEDFTTRRGFRTARRALYMGFGTKTLVWISIPCVGGSTWQHINWAKGTEATRDQIREHRRVFEQLWDNIEALDAHVIKSGAKVAIEWPRYCTYWRHNKVKNFVERKALWEVNFNGCAFGLKA